MVSWSVLLALTAIFVIVINPALGQLPTADAKIYSAKIETGWSRYKSDVFVVGAAIAIMLGVLAVVHITDCFFGEKIKQNDQLTRALNRWKSKYNA